MQQRFLLFRSLLPVRPAISRIRTRLRLILALVPTAIVSTLPLLPLGTAGAAVQDNCVSEYRPKLNETAFAAVGAPLKVADERCTFPELIIPFDQKAAAVSLPAGTYQSLGQTEEGYLFALHSAQGKDISSCALCDPLRAAVVPQDAPDTLCVKTLLNLTSCALKGSLSFAVHERQSLKENLCTPSLIYYGRSGDLLKFAVSDCKAVSAPALIYDLKLGSTIRFLNDSYLILQADNQGLSYRYTGSGTQSNPAVR